MSSEHHFTLFSAQGLPPNGWKAAIVLEELALDYHPVYLDLSAGGHKDKGFTKYNPNGRIPALVDHQNNDFVIWESNAIIAYLIEKYDPERKLSFERFEDKMQQLQWLFFQASGQGPYFGQAGYFLLFSPEKIPSVITRYQKEILRVLGVLDGVLSERRWLVGDKCSAADLSFITWNDGAFTALVKDFEGFDLEKDFPAVHRWHNAMVNRPAVSKVMAERAATMAQ
ncbi:glutathione S-transferase [Earliella scabrosa]|nr:glutathione S-transferase [Earliella scabrosa]